jgi:hypothetical protein
MPVQRYAGGGILHLIRERFTNWNGTPPETQPEPRPIVRVLEQSNESQNADPHCGLLNRAAHVRGCEKTHKKTGKIEDLDNLRAVGNACMLWPNKSR